MRLSLIHIFFYGDSIPYGCDASSLYNREPNQSTYPQLFRTALNKIFGSRIRMRNTAVGGMTSAWGLENIQSAVSYTHLSFWWPRWFV